MNPYLEAFLALLAALVTSAAVIGSLLLFHTRGRIGRAWRYFRGTSRNRKRQPSLLSRALRRVK